MVRFIGILFILCLPGLCLADELKCASLSSIEGKFNNDITPSNMASFTTDSGIIIFSFNSCQVLLSK